MRTASLAFLMLCAFAYGQADDAWFNGIGQTDQVTRGLVAYYSMRQSGTNVYNEVTGGFGGTTPATLAYSNGVVNGGLYSRGLSSDGITNSVDVTGLTITNNTWSISLWFNQHSLIHPDGASSYSQLFDSENPRIMLFPLSITTGQNIGHLRGGTFYSQGASLSTGAWHHVVYVFDGPSTVTTLYADGAKYNAVTGGVYTGIGGISRIGSRHAFSGGWYALNGSIDEVRFYRVSLTQDEVRSLWKMGRDILELR